MMLNSVERSQAQAFGRLIEMYALAADWSSMRRLETQWVDFAYQYHGRERTELCQAELDARYTVRQLVDRLPVDANRLTRFFQKQHRSQFEGVVGA